MTASEAPSAGFGQVSVDQPLPTWSTIRQPLARPTFGSMARTRVAIWITEVLESWLGPDWPSRAAGARALAGLTHLHCSNPAFFEHLSLALRLESLRDVPGRAVLVDSLRADFGAGRRRHVETQLELACLASSQEWAVALEERLSRSNAPVDVVLRRPGTTLPFEVKVVLTSQRNAEVTREVRSFDPIFIDLLTRFDVLLGGAFPGVPSGLGRSQLRSLLEPAAALVQGDHVAREVDWNGTRLTLSWAGSAAEGVVLSMPMPLQDDRRRLPGKIGPKDVQATKSAARWLRLDMVGGYFQFSSWWNQPFTVRLDAIVKDLQAAAAASAFEGLVLSSGLVSSGRCRAETVEHPFGAVGMVRQVTPLDSRTTVVLPLDEARSTAAAEVASLYDAEPAWLDEALQRCGQPPLVEIMLTERE